MTFSLVDFEEFFLLLFSHLKRFVSISLPFMFLFQTDDDFLLLTILASLLVLTELSSWHLALGRRRTCLHLFLLLVFSGPRLEGMNILNGTHGWNAKLEIKE